MFFFFFQIVPPQITVPLLQVCDHLDIPPVATYAGVCLWNWKPIFADEPANHLGNLTCINTFSGSMDEQWFYLISVAIEARGAPALPLMLRAIGAARNGDSELVTKCLQNLAELIDGISEILQRMYENCDPHIFYNRIRPFLAGSKNMADAGLPNGLIYDDGASPRVYRQYGGGSNAQSSLIQFFDIVLGVQHRPTGVKGPPAESNESSESPRPRHNFIHEMRGYMPGPHRRFLEHVSAVANIREYVSECKNDRALCMAYDACLAMLRVLRDKHIQIVSRYIVIPSRESRAHAQAMHSSGVAGMNLNVNLATAANGGDPAKKSSRKLRGTGGTALIPFLKQARDETGEPTINSWAKRLLSNGPAEFGTTASLSKLDEHPDGQLEVVGLAGTWKMDDSEGGICHW